MTLTGDFLTDIVNFIVIGIIETSIFIFYAAGVLGVRIKDIMRRICAASLLLIVASSIEALATSYFVASFMAIAVLFVNIVIIFRQPFMKSLYIYALTYIFTTFVNLLLLIVITPIVGDNYTTIHSYIIGSVTLAVTVILYLSGTLEKLYTALIVKSDISRNIIILMFAACLMMTAYRRLSIKDFMDTLLIIAFALIIVTILYAGLYKGTKKLHESRKQLRSYEQYLPIVEELIDQVRMRQHDFGNELQAIRMLPAVHSDYDSLSLALSDELAVASDKTVMQNVHLLNINMKLIAGFLFSCFRTAEDMGLELKLDIKSTQLTSAIPEFELLDVLSILTDNAFEASESGDSVYITINSDGERTIIETMNPGAAVTADMRRSFFSKGYSTKPKKERNISRGIGLYKLKQLADKYNGGILLDNQTINGQTYIRFRVEV